MKYIDKGIIYIPIDKDTTKEEMDKLRVPYSLKGQTVVFLRSGDQNMKTAIINLLNASL